MVTLAPVVLRSREPAALARSEEAAEARERPTAEAVLVKGAKAPPPAQKQVGMTPVVAAEATPARAEATKRDLAGASIPGAVAAESPETMAAPTRLTREAAARVQGAAGAMGAALARQTRAPRMPVGMEARA